MNDMKSKHFFFIVILILFSFLSYLLIFHQNRGSEQNAIIDDEKYFYSEGIIADINEDERKILLFENLTRSEYENHSVDDLLKNMKDAIWFSVSGSNFNQLRIGQEVAVWYVGVEESYPGQGKAIKIIPINRLNKD
jgi:hypothetical protein